jgi:Sec-independent protein translocase protein TatA
MSAYKSAMTDIKKEIKNAEQDLEAKAQTAKDHAEGKPSSETLNKAKVKVEDAVAEPIFYGVSMVP